MSRIIAGLFPSQVNYQILEQNFRTAGISENDYMIFLEDPEIDQNYFLSCVKINEAHTKENINKILHENEVAKTFEFSDLEIDSYDEIKQSIATHCKSEIFKSPEIRKHESHDGITSEVKF